jgi:hypothetical protein
MALIQFHHATSSDIQKHSLYTQYNHHATTSKVQHVSATELAALA